MHAHRTTLMQFLNEERRRHKHAVGELNALVLNVAIACKTVAKRMAHGALSGELGSAETENVQGETQQKMDVIANDIFLANNEWGGMVAGMVSEEMDEPYAIAPGQPLGRYLLLFDPLDGSSNLDINGAVGSIFSILRAREPGKPAELADFLKPGTEQVCAGYALYGPSTMLVLTVGTGVYAFTLEPELGEFILTHSKMTIPPETKEFAINTSNSRFWEPAVSRYVHECLAGKSGVREKDFNMRWIAALVADAHRILTRGGVYLYPRDSKDPAKAGRLRLLYEANPIAFLIEQAGGMASTGRERIREIVPESLHQRIGFIFGARSEIERIEAYHRDTSDGDSKLDTPLFNHRGLFRESA